MTHPQSPASPLPEAAEPHPNCPNAFICAGRCLGNRCAEAMEPIAAPSPVAQAPAQAGEVGAFEDWWYGHDGVRQRQVAYLGWPCTKELAESIWNGAREQAASSLPVALQQAREALAYHQAQTRPIDKTVDAIKAIDAALATQPLAAPVQQEAEAVRLLTDAKAALQLINKRSDHYWRKVDRSLDAALERLATPPAQPVLAPVVREPLTDEQLHKVLDKAFRQAALDGTWRPGREQSVIAARAIERAHGIQATTGEQSHG